MKQYTLITRLPKSRTKSVDVESNTPYGEDRQRTALENLLEYKPDSNNIDSLLHKAILDDDELNSDRFTMSLSPTSSQLRNTMDVGNESDEDELVE